MEFHEIRFPTRLSFGALGGPERKTEIVTLANGFEERNTPWAHARRRFDAGMGLRALDDIAEVIAFFEARRGRLYGFRWKDWSDYKSCAPSRSPHHEDQVLGHGDGTRTDFALIKTYRAGEAPYARPIIKPVAGSVQVGLHDTALTEGTDYTLDLMSGQIVFAEPPVAGVAVTAGFEFDVPVRFDTDRIEASIATFQAGDVPGIPVVEIRV